MWLFGGRTPPSFSHSILVSTPPAAEQVNSTALPWAFTSTWGATRTASGATEGKEKDSLGFAVTQHTHRNLFSGLYDLFRGEQKRISGIFLMLLAKLTSYCDFSNDFAVAHFVAGHTLVASSILSGSQVYLQVPCTDFCPRREVSIQLGPNISQRRSAVGQALQPDHLPDPHGHIIRHRGGIWRS